jgi:ferredoxin
VYSKILKLRFPATEVQKPLVCYLARDYDLVFNILNAGILPRKEGFMVLELSGSGRTSKTGVKYLKNQGVDVQNASQEIKRNEKKCTHCGSCTAVCPTGALAVKRPEMEVDFRSAEMQCLRIVCHRVPAASHGRASDQPAFF